MEIGALRGCESLEYGLWPNLSQPNRHPNFPREVISPGLPSIHHPPEQWKRLSEILLTRIWCFIADLYRKAALPKDAEIATNEALDHLDASTLDMSNTEKIRRCQVALVGICCS